MSKRLVNIKSYGSNLELTYNDGHEFNEIELLGFDGQIGVFTKDEWNEDDIISTYNINDRKSILDILEHTSNNNFFASDEDITIEEIELTTQEEIEALLCVANGYEPYLAINKYNGEREVYSSSENYLQNKSKIAGIDINRDFDEWNKDIDDQFIDVTPFDKTLYYVDYNSERIVKCTITSLSRWTEFHVEQIMSDVFDFNYHGLVFVNEEDAINHYKEKYNVYITEDNYSDTIEDDAEPTSRLLENNQGGEEWVQVNEIYGVRYNVYYIFKKDDIIYDDGSSKLSEDYDWSYSNIDRIELNEEIAIEEL